MENKKQSSIEWLAEKIEGEKTLIARIVGLKEYNKIIQQAKLKHKQEIIDAVDYGILLYVNDPITSEDYYQETFNPQNNDN
jgi:hypothetical protein